MKSKFGQGYVLEIKLKHGSDVDEESLRQFVKKVSEASGLQFLDESVEQCLNLRSCPVFLC